MLFRLFQRLSYANVPARSRLFVALGGTAYAVNSVGTRHHRRPGEVGRLSTAN